MRERNMLISVVFATSGTLLLGWLSVWWVFSAVVPAVPRGLDFLLLPSIIMLIIGAGFCWYWLNRRCLALLGERV